MQKYILLFAISILLVIPAKAFSSTSDVLSLGSEFDERQALKAFFGNCEPEQLISKWSLPDSFFSSEINQSRSGRQYWGEEKRNVQTELIKTFSYQNEGIEKKFLVTSTTPTGSWFGCHACVPLLGGFVWEKINNEWLLTGFKEYVTFTGGWGKIKTDQMEILPEADALLIKNHHVGQGYHTYSASIIAQVGIEISKIWGGVTGESNTPGACGTDPGGTFLGECWEYEYSMNFVKGANVRFPDLHLVPTVTGKPTSKTFINKTRVLSIVGNKYNENNNLP